MSAAATRSCCKPPNPMPKLSCPTTKMGNDRKTIADAQISDPIRAMHKPSTMPGLRP